MTTFYSRPRPSALGLSRSTRTKRKARCSKSRMQLRLGPEKLAPLYASAFPRSATCCSICLKTVSRSFARRRRMGSATCCRRMGRTTRQPQFPRRHPLVRIGVDRWQYDLWYQIIRAELEGHPDQVDLSLPPSSGKPAASRYGATTPELLAGSRRTIEIALSRSGEAVQFPDLLSEPLLNWRCPRLTHAPSRKRAAA